MSGRLGRTCSEQARSLSGGVAEGDITRSPGCSGMSVSTGPGGVDEVFLDSVDEPLRETQVVSITRTPMLCIFLMPSFL